MNFDAWNEFNSGDWQSEINVRDFIQKNYTPYEGNDAFLALSLRYKTDENSAGQRQKTETFLHSSHCRNRCFLQHRSAGIRCNDR